MAITVRISDAGDFEDLKSRINTASIGKIIARVIETQSTKAFLDQKLGEHTWPERYPSQEDPFVNIAALVNWTGVGGNVLERFFDRRPALMGTGELAGSISGEVKGDLVEVGSALNYAGLHQWGGSSEQNITEQTKTTIGRYIGEEKKGGKWVKKKRMGEKQKEQRKKYWFKLAPLLGKDTLTTEVNQRPFLGITDENEVEMVDTIERFIATGKGG